MNIAKVCDDPYTNSQNLGNTDLNDVIIFLTKNHIFISQKFLNIFLLYILMNKVTLNSIYWPYGGTDTASVVSVSVSHIFTVS